MQDYRVVLNVVVYVKAEDEDAAEGMAYRIAQGRGGEGGVCDWDTMSVDEDPFNNDEEEG